MLFNQPFSSFRESHERPSIIWLSWLLLDYIGDKKMATGTGLEKDIYGVYAEPVDPEELPDYHDIIEHPMNFATVRSKLGNGSYATLEQFELYNIQIDNVDSVAHFLELRGMIDDALEVATDPDYKFELAIQLSKLDTAKAKDFKVECFTSQPSLRK
ncbi:hypothetical protein CASFOL_014328 [Castilleja foliolosa]|uniref:Bromo domain-containing protein n=1 Tax=Castilleja foliolosa TaxID=1961234 RepID=A0ABD3DMJ7_9LAMI